MCVPVYIDVDVFITCVHRCGGQEKGTDRSDLTSSKITDCKRNEGLEVAGLAQVARLLQVPEGSAGGVWGSLATGRGEGRDVEKGAGSPMPQGGGVTEGWGCGTEAEEVQARAGFPMPQTGPQGRLLLERLGLWGGRVRGGLRFCGILGHCESVKPSGHPCAGISGQICTWMEAPWRIPSWRSHPGSPVHMDSTLTPGLSVI